MVVEINFLEIFLIGLYYFITVVLSISLIGFMRKSFLRHKLERLLKLNSALISLMYKTNGTFYHTLKTISRNKELFGPISTILTKYGIKYIIEEGKKNGNDRESLLSHLQNILMDPDKFINEIEDNLGLLDVELELSKQYLTMLDEKISILLFVDYFIPFIILFISILNLNFFKFFIVLYPFFSIFSIFLTYKVINQ